MQITLNQKEIEEALVDYVGNQGISLSNRHINVSLVAGKELTAAIQISKEAITAPAKIQEPLTGEPTVSAEDLDRETLKAELDRRGIEYAPKAHTPTLQSLLDEAQAKEEAEGDTPDPQPQAEPALEEEKQDESAVDTGSIFGNPSTVPQQQETAKEPDVPWKEQEAVEPEPEAEKPEEEDNRPLFGR